MKTKAIDDVPAEFLELLSLTPVDAKARARLTDVMRAPTRYYHNVRHLAQLWRRHRRHAASEGFDRPEIERLVASTIAYHDSVYNTGQRDNEARSAELWLTACDTTQWPEADRQWVATTIRATADHLAYQPVIDPERPADDDPEALRERARVWVLDLDLTPLGDPSEDFDRNTDQLRREAGNVSDEDWRAGQTHFLGKLAAATHIYRIPTLRAIYEASARENIARLLARLGA